jgi:hypothetical protein
VDFVVTIVRDRVSEPVERLAQTDTNAEPLPDQRC